MRRGLSILTGALALLCAGCGNVEDGYQWVVSSVGMDAESAMRAQARKSLDALIDAYQARNVMGFMQWVSPDYPFAPALLESQLSRSFTQYFYIEIMYDLSSVVPSADEKTLSVNVNFRRKLGYTRTGRLVSDDGSTNLLLQKRGDAYVLLQQHSPELFK